MPWSTLGAFGQAWMFGLSLGQMSVKLSQPRVLPMTRAEMDRLGWAELDVLLISGDAYVDHPSFGAALLGRWLIHHGYRTGIIAQPRWTTTDDIKVMGRPRLFAGVTAGALDSMLAHYTAFRKKRSDDAYTPGGVAGRRPNRASIVYSSLVKQAFAKLPIVLGGIEASLRRLTHYDFWTDQLRRSILLDAKADLLLYGMAERGILEAARVFEGQVAAGGERGGRGDFLSVAGVGFLASEAPEGAVVLASHEEIVGEKKKLMEITLAMEGHVQHAKKVLAQPVEKRFLILTPAKPLESAELDVLYGLPFTRDPHPAYKQAIPAAEMIRFSINSHRGCAGGCSFCTLGAHQGRSIRSRSRGSLLAEAEELTRHAKWAGSISDVGGPSANMWGAYCKDDPTGCGRASCLYPNVCPHFAVDQMATLELLREMKKLPKVKHVRIASGIRHDLALKDRRYIRALVREFVGGQLKIAPEHLGESILQLMRKPGRRVFEEFLAIFEEECIAAGKEQYIIPYLLTAFPGSGSREKHLLGDYLKERGWRPQQVQCFIPLPGTVAAAMYFAGIDVHGKAIPVPRSDAERLDHHYAVAAQPAGPRRKR